MSEIISLTDITDALEKISAASTNQPGNQEEIFKLLKQTPTLSKSILPIVYNARPVSSSHADVLKLFQHISKHLVNELKQLVQGTITTIDRPKQICICIENLTLLAGNDFAKERLTEVVSHATYLLIQENMEFVEDTVGNLPKVTTSLVLLIEHIKPFAMDMCEALFLCEVLNMTCAEQKNWISNVILEKLSTELLTIIDALREYSIKSTVSVAKVTNFLDVDSNSVEDTISTVNLLSLGSALNSFNDLERSLHGGIASKVQKLKNSSDKFKKSSLKHRLPDILRSSQEANWMRSLTIFGEWDWQEILRDIASAIANSMKEAFENFHTKEMSSLRDSQGDEAYLVDTVPSLSSDLLPGPNTPKKTICQFKEVASLMKSTLPYAVIGSRYKPLSSLLSCYIDECSQSLKMMKTYLSMLLNDFPEKVTASVIFCTIAACEDVIATLQYCSANINTDVRAPFQGICQSYCDMNNTLKNAVIQYLRSRIRLNILHDGESNHFSDPKEFADGERCSHAVENWRRFLDRSLEQMSLTLSSFSKTEIFSEIFIDSLNVLKIRYLRCEPTYNRAKQLRLDIPYIISTCEKYCSLTAPDMSLFDDSDRSKVYSTCELLHAVMTIINAPLTLLRNWLSNAAADKKNGKLTDSKSEVVRFLKSQDSNQDSLVHCLVTLLSNGKSFLHFVQSDDFAKELGSADYRKFHHCMYEVLASGVSLWCDEFFNCALMSVNNDHSLLLQNCMTNSNSYKFPWQSVFFQKLDDILCKSLVSPVSFLTHPCWSHFLKNVISSFPSNIKATLSDMASNGDDTESRLMVSVILILLGLQNALYILPDWLTKFLTKLQPISSNQSENNATAIKVILNETKKILRNPDIWEEHCKLDLTKNGVDAMHRASLVLSRICSYNFQPNGVGDECVTQFLSSLRKEADECFRVLPEMEFHYTDEELVQECKLELAHIETNNENAWNSLNTIQRVLKDNADWLKLYWMKSYCEDSAVKSLQTLQSEDEKGHAALSRISWRTIKIIVLHRWEAKTGAALTDKQAEDLDMILHILEQSEAS